MLEASTPQMLKAPLSASGEFSVLPRPGGDCRSPPLAGWAIGTASIAPCARFIQNAHARPRRAALRAWAQACLGLSGFILNPWQTLETPTLVNAREERAIAVSIVEFLDFEDWERVFLVSRCTFETPSDLVQLQYDMALVAELREADRGTSPLG